MTKAVSRGGPVEWVQLSPPLPFGFTFFFFFFFLFCWFGLLPVRVLALETESSVKSLALPEPRFSRLGSGALQERV